MGILRPQVVLPDWCRRMEPGALGLILDHELEHVRTKDLRLLISAAALPILVPWCLPLWWQLARLRLAVEGDCDLRVIAKNPDRIRAYLELLLEVGRRSPERGPVAAMLSEPHETLKRRIRIMTMPSPNKPWIQGFLLTAAAALLVAVACWAPGPTDVSDDDVDAADAELVRTLTSDGIREVQNQDWSTAIDKLRSARELAPSEATSQEVRFWLAYALFQQTRKEERPQTVETARKALPGFQEALRLFERSGDYARRAGREEVRADLMSAIRTFIEIEEAIIRRGPR